MRCFKRMVVILKNMERSKPKTICIVAPEYIYANPRTVKEADALWQAGFDVRVVFSQGNLEMIKYFDDILLKEKPWRYSIVGWSPLRKKERILYFKSKLRYHIFRRLPALFYSLGKLAEHGEGRIYRELARLAALEKADIYIGHYPTGLAAAAYAASHWKAKLGYDFEDLYAEEHPQNKKQTKRIKTIESRYLHNHPYVSCVSELIADEIVKSYNIGRPTVIHNVFPWSERDKIDGQIKDRRGSSLSLYWHSQVIGEYRGIQDAIRAAGLLKERVQIHLRGYLSEEVKNNFSALAKECGVEQDLYFHPPVPPTELLSRTVEHDVGLALDQPVNLSRRLTVSNKFFFYLLAGLAIAATDIPGQRYIMSTCPDVGFLYPPGDFKALAGHLYRLISEPNLLQTYKQAALRAAKERWNWEIESKKLVENIEHLFNE